MTGAEARAFLRSVRLPPLLESTGPDSGIDLGHLPDGLVAGTTLLDLSAVPDAAVRRGLSLSLLFASRVAEADPAARDADAWLAAYRAALVRLGFRLAGSSVVTAAFGRTGVAVHRALGPWLRAALGGAGAGPLLLGLLEGLGTAGEAGAAPWIDAYDRQVRRFGVQEMHFGAARPAGLDTEVRHAVARLDLRLGRMQVLFVRVTRDTARFCSQTTAMAVSNSLMAVIEDDLRQRLETLAQRFIWAAPLG